jgi:putative FmdB family regulatory protein
MPLYEYECQSCGEIQEVLQKFSDVPLKKCRYCSGKLNRILSSNAFHLKGSGWYVTDYGKKTSSASNTDSVKNTKNKNDLKN